MAKERIAYIDCLKGLLILLVVLHHLPDALDNSTAINAARIIRYLQPFYVGFFMSAFYIASGMVTSFDKPFGKFFLSGFKSLMIPAFVFHYLFPLNVFSENGWGLTGHELILTLFRGASWFCSSMFLARLFYWFLVKYVDKTLFRLFILLAMSFVGAILYTLDVLEPWSIWHALSLTVFYEIGKIIGEKRFTLKQSTLSAILYFFFVVVLIFAQVRTPRISYSSMVAPHEVIPYNVLSLLAIIPLIWLSEKLCHYQFLNYLGKGSLVIFLTHGFFLRLFVYLYVSMFPMCKYVLVSDFIFPLCTYLFALGMSCIMIEVFNKKYIKYLLGKF